MTLIATAAYLFGILVLLWLDRRSRPQTSSALWIPVIWMSFAGSRSLSEWLQTGSANSDNSPLDRLVAATLMVVAIYVLARRGSKVTTLLKSNLPVVLFFLYCAISILWSDFPVATITRWWKAMGDLLMILVVLTDPAPIDAVWRVLSRVGFVLLPLSILFNKYYPALGRYYDWWVGRVFYCGVAVDKNMLGVTCLAFALASTWCVVNAFGAGSLRRKTGSLVAHGMVVLMALWLFVRIDSMTSLSCFLLGASVIVAMRVRFVAKAAWIRHGLLTAAWAVISSVLFFGLGGSILTMMGRDPTLTGRTDLWAVLSSLNPNPLLGAGFEAFWRGPKLDDLARIGIEANEAHNGYFETYLNLGWIGVTLLASIIIVGYRNISRAIRVDPRTGTLWLAYFITGLVYSLTEAGFRIQTPMWITFLMAIMGSSATSTIARDSEATGLLEHAPQVIPVPRWSGVAARGRGRASESAHPGAARPAGVEPVAVGRARIPASLGRPGRRQ